MAGLFLDAFILGKIPCQDPSSLPTAYLAQSDLLDDKDLVGDVPPLDVFEAGSQETIYRRTMWIGPKASFTPFHKDPYIGLYSQSEPKLYNPQSKLTKVIGSKTFHVLPPSATPLLYPSTDPRHANTSTIPLPVSAIFSPSPQTLRSMEGIPPEIINKARENLEKAFELPGAALVKLEPGESVLVPEGWWHSAEGGDGAGVGVGAWFR